MELTAAASWLNTAFAGYDRMILSALHSVSNGFFTFLFRLITLIGEKGLVFFLAALLFMCFPKTRKLGVCIFGTVCCGALITNVILKDLVARPRPLTVTPYSQWWAEIGSPAEDGWSFPSGHVTAAAAGMVSIRLIKGKKWTVPAVVWILLMMIARNYLMAHYPTDVLAAAIIGTASAFIAYYITQFIFRFLRINRRKKWCGFVLNWSAPDLAGIPSKLGLTGEAEIHRASEKEHREKASIGSFIRRKAEDAPSAEGSAASPAVPSGRHSGTGSPKSSRSSAGYQGKHLK